LYGVKTSKRTKKNQKEPKRTSKRQFSAFFAISALEFPFLSPMYWVSIDA
jgi:hypothetical protein